MVLLSQMQIEKSMKQLIIQLMVQVGPSSPSRGARKDFFKRQRQGGRHVAAEASVAFRVRLTAGSVRAEHVQHLPESPGRRAFSELGTGTNAFEQFTSKKNQMESTWVD